MSQIKFGTDGWRAVISDDFTFANVRIVAQAIADYVRHKRSAAHRKNRIVIGYDTRFLSEDYAQTIASVLAANGIRVILADRPTPTPSVSYAIIDHGLTGGVMVTASHNPARYNGIKYKNSYGASAGPEIISEIEHYLHKNKVRQMPITEARSKGLVAVQDIIPQHLKFAIGYVDLPLIKKSGLKILVDSMHGAGDDCFAHVLAGGKTHLDMIRNNRETSFGGVSPEPKLQNLTELIRRTRKEGYDLGLATDGDADRLGLVGPDGKIVTGQKIMSILLLHMIEDRKMRGDVVQTICGTGLIDKICERYRLTMHETPVGFKYIADIMVAGDVLIGGEETGGIGFKKYIPERDGIMTGLLIMEMLAMRRKRLPEILRWVDKEYGTYEYRRMDIAYPSGLKKRLMDTLHKRPLRSVLGRKVVAIKAFDGHKFMCEDESWILFRLSGTEPILRIYAEASTEERALAMLAYGKKMALSV